MPKAEEKPQAWCTATAEPQAEAAAPQLPANHALTLKYLLSSPALWSSQRRLPLRAYGSSAQTKPIKRRATYQTTKREYLDIKVIPAARDLTSTLPLLPGSTLSASRGQLAHTQECSSCMEPALLVQDLSWQTQVIKSVQEHDLFEGPQLFSFFPNQIRLCHRSKSSCMLRCHSDTGAELELFSQAAKKPLAGLASRK